jgi:thiosulfate/3-mercaptopyruvate sulfurtransferase
MNNSPINYPGAVVSVKWLAEHRHQPQIRIVDATVHLPDTGRDANAEFLQEHIPGAGFFDLSVIANPNNPLPRKFPPKDIFIREVGKLGIDNQTHVIAYDTPGLYSAARVWWLFRQYGYDHVSILDGGLKSWKAHGLAVEAGTVDFAPSQFHVDHERDLLALWQHVLTISGNGNEQLLDARTAGRFAGTEVDRYPGARPGHIPNSLHLYWADLLNANTRELLALNELRDRITNSGIDLTKPVTLTCGSGLTACILALGLHLLGKDDWKVYDGSWDEWGRRAELPVETST